MLCQHCNSIRFGPWPGEDSQPFGDFFYAVIHETRESFLRSLSAGCHLCIMIRGQLGNSEVDDRTCELLGADVVLRRSAKAGGSTSLSIISRLGAGLLDVINSLPGLLHEFLDCSSISALAPWTDEAMT